MQKYERAIESSGGIDLQVLGIGENGHIGFNEPAEKLNVYTGLVNLTEETIKANSRFFSSVEGGTHKGYNRRHGNYIEGKENNIIGQWREKSRGYPGYS